MTISNASLKWYQCTTWTEGATHGGAIDTGSEITTNVSENTFDNVSDDERIAGDTEYRKVFFRNENADTYPNPLAWIEDQPDTGTVISILQGGSLSVQGNDSAAGTGTVTWAASTAVVGSGTAFLTEFAPGEKVFNSTDDTNAAAVVIASIESDTAMTLGSSYGGTTGAGKDIKCAAITGCTFVSPDAFDHADVLTVPKDLVQNASFGIWIKRVVSALAAGVIDTTFELKVEDS